MQYGQTNGIPQGSVLSDFIAEMILAYIDKELDERLEKVGILDYRIIRYRDDYRIYSNSKEEIEKIAFLLQDVLSGFNFQLNTKKNLPYRRCYRRVDQTRQESVCVQYSIV